MCPVLKSHPHSSIRVPLLPTAFIAVALAAFSCLLVPTARAEVAKPGEADAPKVTAQDIGRRIAKIHKERKILVHWKYTPDIIPVHIRGMLKVSQASIEQADMILRLTERMLAIWPPELTRHVSEVFIFNEVEMHGVKGVCMEYDGRIFMTANLPEYVLWPRIIHEASHAVSRYVPLDDKHWPVNPPGSKRYIGAAGTQGNPFEVSEEIRNNGFIEKYASIDRDEEFAVLSQYLFTAPEEMRKLMKEYPAIRERASLAIDYYKAISSKVDLSAYEDLLEKK